MSGNSDLNGAKAARKDEFYTQLTDIEKELKHYKNHFKDKVVFCNCDDPFESNFFKYFVLNFNRLGLKKLICTSYISSPVATTELNLFSWQTLKEEERKIIRPYKAVVTKVYDKNNDGMIDLEDIADLFKSGENSLTRLEGDGDFRSKESLSLLDESDVVVTNPPFSLFREFVSTLIEHDKKFIIIGNINAVTYKEVFPLIKDNKLWIGVSIHSGDRAFFVPDDYPLDASGCGIDASGRKFIRVKGVRWFTNLDVKQRHESLILYKRYSPESYPRYVNFDAIDVLKTQDIPCDYAGNIGVPITFLDKYNPEQFEIIGNDATLRVPMETVAKRGEYNPGGNVFYLKDNSPDAPYKYKASYKRFVVRNKHPEQPKEN